MKVISSRDNPSKLRRNMKPRLTVIEGNYYVDKYRLQVAINVLKGKENR